MQYTLKSFFCFFLEEKNMKYVQEKSQEQSSIEKELNSRGSSFLSLPVK